MDTPIPVSHSVPNARQKRRMSRRVRWLVGAGAVGLGGLVGSWVLIHSTSWAGPMLSDTLRAVVGPEAVARLQDIVYGVEDRVNLATRSGEAPAAHWEVPEEETIELTPVDAGPTFHPEDVGPVHLEQAAEGDGVWVTARPDDHDGPPLIYKTLLHPDAKRAWAEVFVTAIDLERTELHLVSGTREPRARGFEDRQWARTQGSIPEEARFHVVAAFNGGFKEQHGHYGMQVGSRQLLPPRDFACTVVRQPSGSLDIGTWTNVADKATTAAFWRQTPPCMVEGGKLNAQLRDGAKTWGATLEGTTVIRRSAIGLSEDQKTLFVAVSNHTTAPAIAIAMQHAGAKNVAQLDVNWSHTRFVVFDEVPNGGPRTARGLFKGFVTEDGMYTENPYPRDFFYVTRRPRAEARQ